MKLQEILNANCIYLDTPCTDKEETIEFLTEKLHECGIIENQSIFLEAVHNREKLSVTGLLNGIAIPHGVSKTVKRAAVVYTRLSKPIKWESMDNSDAKNVFLLAIPEDSEDNTHIKMISELARALAHDDVINQLNSARTPDEVIKVLSKGGDKE